MIHYCGKLVVCRKYFFAFKMIVVFIVYHTCDLPLNLVCSSLLNRLEKLSLGG